ncbi:TPA: hypothetical protein REY24_000468 [Klebsiella pneumoniae]|jgi:hypothetical protein|uniref:Uncharacterized protein n=12 Tax=Gammaproteobacteria TaxID=1236 RepID=A0A0H3GVI7_KLEPH|nr:MULTISPECIES: hypothetical protein [Enterobacteriaceae]YP_005228810.1 hypothetical protein KPHS_45100 [Klebsiella pneumoniae subsp. pneumoniae HS11286]AHM83196.1 hypothetical protein KPNJ1_00790 [Klebsiella pneumoniae 30660/NJST258_1]AKR98575.1 hypothetical protein H222_03870 [Klebsiella pneumoniae UHKPC33]MBT9345462.1 hypothetical protein [Providencia stuartii]MDI7071584.1 hypothetical protein [Pseudomonas aeruginosa]OJS63272.1 hypothetical protein BK400_32080 [Escherichia coli]CCM83204.
MSGKYTPETLLPALRLFIEARNKANAAGFPDNGGAIHSVERIIDVLCIRVKYGLTHVNNLKKMPTAECSIGAYEARQRGDAHLLRIEHVMPQRAFAKKIIDIVEEGATDEEIIAFIEQNYRLVLLNTEETSMLNLKNRSRISPDRLGEAGIVMYQGSA